MALVGRTAPWLEGTQSLILTDKRKVAMGSRPYAAFLCRNAFTLSCEALNFVPMWALGFRCGSWFQQKDIRVYDRMRGNVAPKAHVPGFLKRYNLELSGRFPFGGV